VAAVEEAVDHQLPLVVVAVPEELLLLCRSLTVATRLFASELLLAQCPNYSR